jgi:hypothetical protein
MNILDDNVPASQQALLRNGRLVLRQIGQDLGRNGMKDDEILPLLHGIDRPTFFTLDGDFFDRRLCHAGYCLVYLDVEEERVAEFVRRLLRHRELNTKAKRMGCVMRVTPTGLVRYRIHENEIVQFAWR